MVDSYGNEMKIIKTKVGRKFSTGKRYTRKEAKKILQEIFDLHDIRRKANYTDFDELFKKVRHSMVNGERYLEILAK